jgi:CRP-like cAMP-binding protein
MSRNGGQRSDGAMATTHRANGLAGLLDAAFPHSHRGVRSRLVETAEIWRIDRGRSIADQGGLGHVLLVSTGHVGLRRITFDGRQVMPRIATTGELATVLPLGERPAAAEAIALTASEIAAWKAGDVRVLAAKDPGLAMDLVDQALDAFETVFSGLDGLLHQDAVLRVARVLYLHRGLFFGDPPVLSRSHLPAMVGTSREMTRRVLRKLESRGMVARVGRDRLTLRDPEGLEAAAAMPAAREPAPRHKFLAT